MSKRGKYVVGGAALLLLLGPGWGLWRSRKQFKESSTTITASSSGVVWNGEAVSLKETLQRISELPPDTKVRYRATGGARAADDEQIQAALESWGGSWISS